MSSTAESVHLGPCFSLPLMIPENHRLRLIYTIRAMEKAQIKMSSEQRLAWIIEIQGCGGIDCLLIDKMSAQDTYTLFLQPMRILNPASYCRTNIIHLLLQSRARRLIYHDPQLYTWSFGTHHVVKSSFFPLLLYCMILYFYSWSNRPRRSPTWEDLRSC